MGRPKGSKNKKHKTVKSPSKSPSKEKYKSDPIIEISPEIKRTIVLIFWILIAILFLLALFDLAGQFGFILNDSLSFLMGKARWFFVFVFLITLLLRFFKRKQKNDYKYFLGSIIFFLSVFGFFMLFGTPSDLSIKFYGDGGILGFLFAKLFIKYTGDIATFFILFTFAFIGFILMFDEEFLNKFKSKTVENEDSDLEDEEIIKKAKELKPFKNKKLSKREKKFIHDLQEETVIASPEDSKKKKKSKKVTPLPNNLENSLNNATSKKYNLPKKEIYLPLNLLSDIEPTPVSAGDVELKKQIISQTLENFNIPVEMGKVRVGPAVTQYTFKPSDGVKLQKIVNLQSDLALSLAAKSLRMEAPIPGKSLVGIEIPNEKSSIVSLKDLLQSPSFKTRKTNLTLVLGKDVSANVFTADLGRMPHLLVAGATGTGKTVCLHGIIASLMYQNSPDDLKFIMIDPKRVEMTLYNGIPYLITPPVTDSRKIVNVFKWAVSEMDRRYQLLASSKKRDIDSYNSSVSNNEKIPKIVIVVDELADLMMLARQEIEPCIIRIAQLARAVGIHLILATQRPSVNVITGLIKANIPARISFSVTSSVDSKTILDSVGAEKLLGKGDMLFSSAEISKSVRIQGTYVSDEEIKNIVLHLKSMDFDIEYDNTVVERPSIKNGVSAGDFSGADDDLFEEAANEIISSKKASTSYLQRKLRIGYARAARLMDLLEEAGVVGPSEGSKGRDVLIDSFDDLYSNSSSSSDPFVSEEAEE
ncbi:DNA translocase FtsK [Patescibacteria group bacterium]|nr:DNA translocase FtsK [Patescibacteria group bacterium]